MVEVDRLEVDAAAVLPELVEAEGLALQRIGDEAMPGTGRFLGGFMPGLARAVGDVRNGMRFSGTSVRHIRKQ